MASVLTPDPCRESPNSSTYVHRRRQCPHHWRQSVEPSWQLIGTISAGGGYRSGHVTRPHQGAVPPDHRTRSDGMWTSRVTWSGRTWMGHVTWSDGTSWKSHVTWSDGTGTSHVTWSDGMSWKSHVIWSDGTGTSHVTWSGGTWLIQVTWNNGT